MPASKKRSESALKKWGKSMQTSVASRSNRPAKYRKWDDEAMIQAIEAVKSGKMSTNQAARAHNVPSQRLCMNDMLPSISSEEKVLKLYLLAGV